MNNINWDFITACIELANLLIVFLPALIVYLYYKVHIVNIYTLESVDGGITIGIHNVTNKTLYLNNCYFIILKKNSKKIIKYEQFRNESYIIIEPDTIKEVKIDYKALNLDRNCKIHLIMKKNRMTIFKKII